MCSLSYLKAEMSTNDSRLIIIEGILNVIYVLNKWLFHSEEKNNSIIW